MPPPFVSPVSLCPVPAVPSTRQTPAVLPRSQKTLVSSEAGYRLGPILALPCYLIHCPRKGNTYPFWDSVLCSDLQSIGGPSEYPLGYSDFLLSIFEFSHVVAREYATFIVWDPVCRRTCSLLLAGGSI